MKDLGKTSLRPLWLACSLLALSAGCGGGQEEAASPAEPPAKPWKADALQGPYSGVDGFCKATGAPACEERTDVILAVGDARKEIASKDGPIQLLTVASNDGTTQRVHLLIRRGTEIFAMPPVYEYNPNDGARHIVAVRSFKEDAGLFVLTYQSEKSSGAGDAARQEVHARQAYCRVVKDLPVACAVLDTEHGVNLKESLESVAEETAEVLVLPQGQGRVSVTAHPRSGAAGMKHVAEPGEYKLTFP